VTWRRGWALNKKWKFTTLIIIPILAAIWCVIITWSTYLACDSNEYYVLPALIAVPHVLFYTLMTIWIIICAITIYFGYKWYKSDSDTIPKIIYILLMIIIIYYIIFSVPSWGNPSMG
jgi:hypothetical protein